MLKPTPRESIVYRGNQLPRGGWIKRPCPKCGAAPGQSCRSYVGAGKVRGEDIGGAVTRRLKNPHAERRAAA